VDTAASLLVTDLQDTSYTITKTGGGTLEVNRLRAGALTISGGTISLIANGTSAAASRARSLQLAGGAAPTATLDLADNDLILIDSDAIVGPGADLRRAPRRRLGCGRYHLFGSAFATPLHATTLGLLRGDEYRAANGAMFDGFDVAERDVLVKYTWYGDTDFNGVVNFDDYVRTDYGFNNHLGGWLNGDFDGNGSVNFDDYVLIDLAFNAQDGTLHRALSFLDGSDRNADGMEAAGAPQDPAAPGELLARTTRTRSSPPSPSLRQQSCT
jgi:hypothetical protein